MSGTNNPIEKALDGNSAGSFDGPLDNLFGAIPKDKGTVIEDGEENPLELSEEEEKTKEKEEVEIEEEQEEPEEEPEDSEDDGEATIIDELASEFGDVDFGEDTEFDDEISATKTYIKKLLEAKTKEIGTGAIEALFKELPEVGALAHHLSQGYSLNSFMKEQSPEDFSPIDLEEASDDAKISLIRKAYKLRGIDDDEIEDVIEVAKDTGKLNARAENSQNYLMKKHEQEVKRMKEEEQENLKLEQQKAEESFKKVEEVLETGKLAGGLVTLDKTKIKTLNDFIRNSEKRNEAWGNLPIDKQLLLDYLVATDFKDVKFGESKVKATLSKNVKIKKANSPRVNLNSSKGSPSAGASPFNLENFFNNVNK